MDADEWRRKERGYCDKGGADDVYSGQSYWLAEAAAAPGSRSAAVCVNLLMSLSSGCISVLVTSSNSLMK